MRRLHSLPLRASGLRPPSPAHAPPRDGDSDCDDREREQLPLPAIRRESAKDRVEPQTSRIRQRAWMAQIPARIAVRVHPPEIQGVETGEPREHQTHRPYEEKWC